MAILFQFPIQNLVFFATVVRTAAARARVQFGCWWIVCFAAIRAKRRCRCK